MVLHLTSTGLYFSGPNNLECLQNIMMCGTRAIVTDLHTLS